MNSITITEERLHALLTEAAEAGAKKALEKVGLHDEKAGEDIVSLRKLLSDWRTARTEIIKAAAKWATIAVLTALAAKLAISGVR